MLLFRVAKHTLSVTGIRWRFQLRYNRLVIIILDKVAIADQLEKMGFEYGRYIKVVVDIEKGILAGGAAMHYDEERLLLEYGSQQSNLWGGGLDLETGEIDYDSMINIRPSDGNPSRTIVSREIRLKFKKIVEGLIINESEVAS